MTPAPAALPHRRWPLLALFAAALAVRLAGAAWRGELVPPAPPSVVGLEAGVVATHLLAGRGFASPFDAGPFSPPSTHLAPGYPLLLAGLTRVQDALGAGPAAGWPGPFVFYAAVAINLLASALVPLVALAIARAARWPTAAGWVAAAAAVLCPEAVRAVGLVWDEALFSLAVAGTLWLMVRWADADLGQRWARRSAAVGGAIGAGALLNPAFVPAAVVAWGVACHAAPVASSGSLFAPRKALLTAGAVLLATLVAFAVSLPWHLRNWVLLDPPARVFVRGNFGLELWTSIQPLQKVSRDGQAVLVPVHPWHGTDAMDGWPAGAGGQPSTSPRAPDAEYAYYLDCARRAAAWIADHPWAYVRHVLEQVGSFWLGVGEAVRWQRSVAVFLLAQGVPAVLGVAGLLLAGRSARQAGAASSALVRVCAAVLLIYPLPFYLTTAAARYRHPVDVVLALGIGWLAWSVVQRLRWPRTT